MEKLYIGTNPVIQLYAANDIEEAKQKHKDFVYGLTGYTIDYKDENFTVQEASMVEGYKIILQKRNS